MNARHMPTDDADAEAAYRVECPDEGSSDEDYWNDLIEAINHNFVLEVEASRTDDG